MTRHQEMESDLAYWLEDQGWDAVIDALATACHAAGETSRLAALHALQREGARTENGNHQEGP